MHHDPSHFIIYSVNDRINYPPVDNNSQSFAENSLCLNSEDFDIDKLFNEYEDINVSRCISTADREEVFSHDKDTDITELIPTSPRTIVSFGDNNCDMVIDTGADMTIVRPQHLSGNGYRKEYCGKMNFIPAFWSNNRG